MVTGNKPVVTGKKLFGTDGVRGVAGEFLTAELALALGRAAAALAPAEAPQVLIVRDTRESGEMLEASLAAGVAAGGGHALLGGVLPTPGAALLTRRHGFDLAAVVSASHNPYTDNGIKIFGPDGTKISDAFEERIEAALDGEPPVTEPGRVRELHGAPGDYLRELELRFRDLDLSGTRVLLDCAHGATYRAAPEIFRRLGADVEAIAAAPDGRNINDGVGSTHVDSLAAATAEAGFDAGFAFDGDGDRVLAADRNGTVVDGDELIALAALHLRHAGRLPGGGVAVTVMTNYGFHTAMREAGVEVAVTPVGDRHVLAVDRAGAIVDGDELIALAALHLRKAGRLRGGGVAVTVMTNYGFHTAMGEAGVEVATTPVGDRYVLETLRERDWALGGEQSGHIIDMGFVPSGDGIAAALLTLESLEGADLADRHAMEKLPQRLINVRLADRAALEAAVTATKDEVAAEHEALTGRGRVLVRASGTEPLVRVMVEAPEADEADAVCARLVAAVELAAGT